MNKAQTKGRFAKLLQLASVLKKCNGKQATSYSKALISPQAIRIIAIAGLVLLAAALFALFFFLEPVIVKFLPVVSITESLMLILMMLSFILSVKNIVTVLYTADDLPVLLPMPFSAGQIVSAKLIVASGFPVKLSLILLNGVCLGLGLRAGLGVAFVIGTLLASVLVPITGIALATLLVVVVFRLFGFIRNRDITMVLGGIFTLLISIGYLIININLRGGQQAQVTATALTALASVSESVPNLAALSRFMFEGSLPALLLALAISAAATALALLVVTKLYFSTALSVETTGKSGKAVTKASLGGSRSRSALKALTAYESKSTRRNPAYLIYGFLMSFFWPLFIVLPMAFGKDSFFEHIQVPLATGNALMTAVCLGITASCFACGFNNLSATAFSREGKGIAALRTLPILFSDYYKSKRNFALIVVSLCSVGYILIGGIVGVIFGVLPLAAGWVVLLSACVCFLLNSIWVNLMLLKNAAKPYFDWDSETEIARKLCWVNIAAFVVGTAALVGLIIVTLLPKDMSGGDAVSVSAILFAVICTAFVVAAAVLANRLCMKKAEKLLMKTE